MYTFNYRDKWFEQILHESIPDEDVRYSLIEEKLTEKIHTCAQLTSAEQLGLL